MSLALSKLLLLLIVTTVAIREGRRIFVRTRGTSDPEIIEARAGVIGTASVLTLVLLMNSLTVMSGLWHMWFEELQYASTSAEEPSQLTLLGRQIEAFLIVSDLVMVIWAGARRVHLPPKLDDGVTIRGLTASFRKWDQRGELMLRAAGFMIGILLLQLARGDYGYRWPLWALFLPFSLLALDRGADWLVRLLGRKSTAPA